MVRHVAPQYAQFQYAGTAVLTVRGPSGRVYRFAGPGSTMVVDPRDAASLAGVRQLRRLR